MKTYEEVVSALGRIEGGASMYDGLDESDVPHLQRLLEEGADWQAARAVIGLQRVGGQVGHQLVTDAAADSRDQVRVAVALCARNLPAEVSDAVLERLVQDDEPSVRKVAVQSVSESSGPLVRELLSTMVASEAHDQLRILAQERLAEI